MIGVLMFLFLTYIITFVIANFLTLSSSPLKISSLRILKLTLNNGNIIYRIQQRLPLSPIWLDCSQMIGMDYYVPLDFNTKQEAQEYLSRINRGWEDDKGNSIKKTEVVKIDSNYQEPNDPSKCPHELVSTEYGSQSYGHCIECDSTVIKNEEGNWKTP